MKTHDEWEAFMFGLCVGCLLLTVVVCTTNAQPPANAWHESAETWYKSQIVPAGDSKPDADKLYHYWDLFTAYQAGWHARLKETPKVVHDYNRKLAP